MRSFAQAWPDDEFVQAVLAQLPWYHQLALLDKLSTPETRRWYAAQAIQHNWSRNVLVMQIETRLLERSGSAVTNFEASLPKPQSDLARESLKDPYRFDFLGLTDEAQEREVEHALVKHVTEFLLELGAGFAFVGRQVMLNLGGDEFFIDLLFYHLKLRCYVVIELKADKFKPEHLGQLGFYLTAVDMQVKAEQDNPTIGLLLVERARFNHGTRISGCIRRIGHLLLFRGDLPHAVNARKNHGQCGCKCQKPNQHLPILWGALGGWGWAAVEWMGVVWHGSGAA